MSSSAAIAELGLHPTAYQQQVLATPEEVDLFLGGGRGPGKSTAELFLAARYCEQYGVKARVLYVRQNYKGLTDLETNARLFFGDVYGSAARYNAQAGIWRLPNGATLELSQLEDQADFRKFQGRSFGLILVDEGGQWPTLELLDLLRSCLRAPKGVPCRLVIAANPGGVGHAELSRRFVLGREPWVPFEESKSGRTWIYAPATYLDNPHLDHEGYRKQLEGATATDPELRKAWLKGDWTVARGAYFASVLDEDRIAISWPSEGLSEYWGPYLREAWQPYLAHDFGVSAPSVTFVVLRSTGSLGPDKRWYPPDSIVLLDEVATNEPGSVTRGMGYTVPRLAEEIKDLARRWGIRPDGVADDACFARGGHDAGSISDEFRGEGVYFTEARKADRRSGWEALRRLMGDAGKPDRPGLYVDRRCSYFWHTVPSLPRDPRRPDDVDTRGPDHAADACRYALGRIRFDTSAEEYVA